MAASKRAAGLNLKVSSQADELFAKFFRGLAPWIVWLFVLPVTAVLLTVLRHKTQYPSMVTVGLALLTAVLSKFIWKVTSSRNPVGRFHHLANLVGCMGWLTVTVTRGWQGFDDPNIVVWALGGLLGCLAWNIRYTSHADPVMDVLPRDDSGYKAGRKQPKYFDGQAVVRVFAARAPVVRRAAERVGTVVPVAKRPWVQPALPAAADQKALPAPVDETAPTIDVPKAVRGIVRNFRDYTVTKNPDLNGAKLAVRSAHPWRVKTEILLVRGAMIPKHVTDAREFLASQNGLPLSSVIVKANPVDHSRVFVDYVLEDVLKVVRHWPGPTAIGTSIGKAPTRFGVYEDREYAQLIETAISETLARRLGMPEKNLSHTIGEGATGSGKSNVTRITITDGATRLDVVEWAIDTVKKYQTLGCCAGAIDWFAVKVAEANSQIKFLVKVITERANYLGMNGYDNWEPGCGLPLLRVTIEEGGIIANELENLTDVLNSARSAGVVIRMSFQRAHHALLDTNARAAFGATQTFGVKKIEDVFAMDDELLHAGADPSLWQDKQPGMLYWSAAGIPFERALMPIRSFKIEQNVCREVIAAHAPTRDAWIRENCPDWFAILEKLDGGNGAYSRRTTGAQVLGEIEQAQARKAGRSTPAAPDAQPERDADVIDMTSYGHRPANEEPVDAELIDDEPAVAAPADGKEGDVNGPPDLTELIDEMDLTDQQRDDLEADREIDPRQPIPPPEVDFVFPPREAGVELDRDTAISLARSYLATQGPGWQFRPRDLYPQLCERLGKSPEWIRGQLLPNLVSEGLLEHNRSEGLYTVSEEIRKAS